LCGLSREAFLPTAQANANEVARRPSAYVPRFFTRPEWEFINAAVDRLIPSDDSGRGGLESRVTELLDRQRDSPIDDFEKRRLRALAGKLAH
jgi:gluconate 2-dehydrogenase gamma chain